MLAIGWDFAIFEHSEKDTQAGNTAVGLDIL